MIKDENPSLQNAHPTSDYSRALTHYSRHHIKFIIPFLTTVAKSSPYSPTFPVFKLLKAISKIFLIGEVEIVFMAYLIRETNWDLTEKIISSYAENVQDIVCYSVQSEEYKKLILYLMVVGFTVKYYLNDNIDDLLEEANKKCLNFKYIFETWIKKYSSLTKRINPRSLNLIYKDLYNRTKINCCDFNLLVDAIITISPAYNSDKNFGKQQKKVAKVVESKPPLQKKLKIQEGVFQQIKKQFYPPSIPVFSSSGFLNLTGTAKRKDSNSVFNPFASLKMNQQKDGMMGSSVVGVLGGDIKEIKFENDCEQLDLGLLSGKSEENIEFEERVEKGESPGYFTSIINLNMSRNSQIDNLIAVQVTRKSDESKIEI